MLVPKIVNFVMFKGRVFATKGGALKALALASKPNSVPHVETIVLIATILSSKFASAAQSLNSMRLQLWSA